MNSDQDYLREYSLWPLLAVIAGWLVAILLVPEYGYQFSGALRASGVAMGVGLLFGLVRASLYKLDAVFRVEYVLIFGVFFWVIFDAIQGAYSLWGVSREAILTMFHSIAIFVLAIWGGSIISSRFTSSEPISIRHSIDSNYLFAAVLLCAALGMLRVMLACGISPSCVVEGLLAPRWQAEWHRLHISGWNVILGRLTLFGYLILPLTFVLKRIEGRITWRVIAGILLGTLFLLVLIQGGGRRQVGIVFGVAFLVWLLANRPIQWRRLLQGLAAIGGLLLIMQIMLEWRYHGFESFFEERVVDSAKDRPGIIQIDKNLYYFSYINSVVPDRHPYTGSLGIYSIVSSAIPRAILPDKPAYNVIPLRDYLISSKGRTWNYTCSAICEFYIIGGYVSVLVGGFMFGVLASFGNRLLIQPVDHVNILFYGVFVMTLFVGLRALREITIMGLIIGMLAGIIFLQRLMVKRWKLYRHLALKRA